MTTNYDLAFIGAANVICVALDAAIAVYFWDLGGGAVALILVGLVINAVVAVACLTEEEQAS